MAVFPVDWMAALAVPLDVRLSCRDLSNSRCRFGHPAFRVPRSLCSRSSVFYRRQVLNARVGRPAFRALCVSQQDAARSAARDKGIKAAGLIPLVPIIRRLSYSS